MHYKLQELATKPYMLAFWIKLICCLACNLLNHSTIQSKPTSLVLHVYLCSWISNWTSQINFSKQVSKLAEDLLKHYMLKFMIKLHSNSSSLEFCSCFWLFFIHLSVSNCIVNFNCWWQIFGIITQAKWTSYGDIKLQFKYFKAYIYLPNLYILNVNVIYIYKW